MMFFIILNLSRRLSKMIILTLLVELVASCLHAFAKMKFPTVEYRLKSLSEKIVDQQLQTGATYYSLHSC